MSTELSSNLLIHELVITVSYGWGCRKLWSSYTSLSALLRILRILFYILYILHSFYCLY